jgi:tripartite-type tricarboxylate transporter receptor subunit TctC
MAAPSGTAPGIIAMLNSELISLLSGEEMRAAMLRRSFVAESCSPDVLAGRINADLTAWRDIVANIGPARN